MMQSKIIHINLKKIRSVKSKSRKTGKTALSRKEKKQKYEAELKMRLRAEQLKAKKLEDINTKMKIHDLLHSIILVSGVGFAFIAVKLNQLKFLRKIE